MSSIESPVWLITGAATGFVTFLDGAAILGSSVLNTGVATFDATTALHLMVASTFASAAVGGTRSTGTSSDDRINLGRGSNVVIGGAGADTIIFGAAGANVIIGDDGQADFTAAGVLTSAKSTDALYGGVDIIAGPLSSGVYAFGGSGGATVIGGLGGDLIKLGVEVDG